MFMLACVIYFPQILCCHIRDEADATALSTADEIAKIDEKDR